MSGKTTKACCRVTAKEFEIVAQESAFAEKIGVPLPTLSPEERERRRLVWRNERFLYKAPCGLCKKPIVSIYPEDSSFPIYCADCYWSDQWDPLLYGRDYDFSRPFFEQLAELQSVVPRLAITHTKSVNSDYTANSIYNKNCYLTSGGDYSEDCLYGTNMQRCKDCVDMYFLFDSELCYGCLDCEHAYQCIGCQECENITNCWFLYDCKGCTNCSFSSNLRKGEYIFANGQLSKEEYEQRIEGTLCSLFENSDWINENSAAIRKEAIHRAQRIVNGQNVVGNYLKNCKNCWQAFDGERLEDCQHIYYALDTKVSADISCIGFSCELLYEVMSGAEIYNCMFCNAIFGANNLQYCISCFYSSDLFGCISLKNHEQYCILNKPYSEKEYEALCQRVVEQMKKNGEYGEFFPPALSPYEYNRSAAGDYLPLSGGEAMRRGFRWFDHEKAASSKATYRPSTTVKDVADSVINETICCTQCGDIYRVVSQELSFYQKMKLPLPRQCWRCRLVNLIHSRKPRRLVANSCSCCGSPIVTPVSPEEDLQVYCESCYLAEVY